MVFLDGRWMPHVPHGLWNDPWEWSRPRRTRAWMAMRTNRRTNDVATREITMHTPPMDMHGMRHEERNGRPNTCEDETVHLHRPWRSRGRSHVLPCTTDTCVDETRMERAWHGRRFPRGTDAFPIPTHTSMERNARVRIEQVDVRSSVSWNVPSRIARIDPRSRACTVPCAPRLLPHVSDRLSIHSSVLLRRALLSSTSSTHLVLSLPSPRTHVLLHHPPREFLLSRVWGGSGIRTRRRTRRRRRRRGSAADGIARAWIATRHGARRGEERGIGRDAACGTWIDPSEGRNGRIRRRRRGVPTRRKKEEMEKQTTWCGVIQRHERRCTEETIDVVCDVEGIETEDGNESDERRED